MGLILDLAVAALVAIVLGSLALLAWTIGVSAVRAVHRGHAEVVALRRQIGDIDARLKRHPARGDAPHE